MDQERYASLHVAAAVERRAMNDQGSHRGREVLDINDDVATNTPARLS